MEDTMGKRVRKNEKTKDVDEEDDEEDERRTVIGTESLEQYLTYDVLRLIFRQLDGKDLSNAAMVCRNWLEAANNERRTRGPVCCMEAMRPVGGVYKKSVPSRLRVKPALSLLITGRQADADDIDCCCSSLPLSSNNVTFHTFGVVMNNREIMSKYQHNFLSVFLPDFPGLRIKMFVSPTLVYTSANKPLYKIAEEDAEGIKEFFRSNTKDGKHSNCLLIFCYGSSVKLAKTILNSLKESYPGDSLSVWGGVPNNFLKACNAKNGKRAGCEDLLHYVGIALTGPLNTWSMIVDRTDNTKEKVEQRLKQLRSSVRLRKHTLGFMFACCERRKRFYSEDNVESTIFKNLFPDVPLVGCFGNGEFGENTIPSDSSRKKTRFYNEFSTVFMILTYG